MTRCSVRRVSRQAGAALFARFGFACLGGATLLLPASSQAGSIRDDVDDSAYISLGNDLQYQAVGAINQSVNGVGSIVASGTIISPRFVLTAAHVSQFAGASSFNVGGATWNGGTTYTTIQTITNSGWPGSLTTTGNDIGLLRLNTPVTGIVPSSRYFGTSEYGQVGTSIGYGRSGTGLTGEVAGSEGTKRGFVNDVDAFGSNFGYQNGIMASDFDDPSGNSNLFGGSAKALEGSITRGDSGGTTYLTLSDGRAYAAGVHSFIASYDPPPTSKYGDFFAWTRITQYNTWIDDNTVNYWNVGTPNGGNGSFITDSNWKLGQSVASFVHPVDGDIAGFNLPGSYSVTFNGAATSYQLLSRAGDVALALNGSTYNLTSAAYDGAMVVGRYSGNNASITINGGTVRATAGDVIIAQLAGSTGRVVVGSSATLSVARDLYVGGTSYGNGGAATLVLQGSTSAATVGGTLRVLNNGIVIYGSGTLTAGTLDIAGGTVGISTGSNRVLQVKKLLVSGNGKLDLNDNDMIIDYTGGTPLSDVAGYVASGFAAGLQNGNGILSTRAKTSPNSGETGKTRIGYGESSDLSLSSFDGVTVDSSAVLLKYTYAGDANLDGKVDIRDLSRLAADFQSSGTWTGGDFNYDGVVDAIDLGLLSTNWQAGINAPLGPGLSFATALSTLDLPVSVPEPASLLSLITAAISLLGTRRRPTTN